MSSPDGVAVSASRDRLAGRLRPVVLAGLLLAIVIVVDRITKHIVRADIGLTQTRKVIPGVVELVHYRNTGVAFDFLSGGGALVVVVTLLALLALLVFFVRAPERRGAWVPTGLLLGGAIGNLLDRFIDGSVTDFIKFPDWPAFNVADIAITFGVLSLLWVLEFGNRPGRDPRAGR
jgi:signal peptidase II